MACLAGSHAASAFGMRLGQQRGTTQNQLCHRAISQVTTLLAQFLLLAHTAFSTSKYTKSAKRSDMKNQ